MASLMASALDSNLVPRVLSHSAPGNEVGWTPDRAVLVYTCEVFLELMYFWISQGNFGPPCLFKLVEKNSQ